jgi:hypothetical protein
MDKFKNMAPRLLDGLSEIGWVGVLKPSGLGRLARSVFCPMLSQFPPPGDIISRKGKETKKRICEGHMDVKQENKTWAKGASCTNITYGGGGGLFSKAEKGQVITIHATKLSQNRQKLTYHSGDGNTLLVVGEPLGLLGPAAGLHLAGLVRLCRKL